MCACFQIRGRTCRPGQPVTGSGAHGPVHHVWAGFARNEILSWWRDHGGLLIDLPAARFAERSDITGKLAWEDVPEGLIIRGLVDLRQHTPLIKIVTRASTPAEAEWFQHPRMPVLERPLFAPISADVELPAEPDLFA